LIDGIRREPEQTMSVEREKHNSVGFNGKASPLQLVRHVNGEWGVMFDVSFTIRLRDGREVIVDKRVNVKANEQRGRRASQRRGESR
jgi:hypothetical protein